MPRGSVYGLVGANGAGKTTLIKHVMGLLRAQSGSVRVFGLDPVADPVGVLSRIGYLSEERDLPGWMRVDELIRYSRAFYPAWDDAYAEELRQAFALEGTAKTKELSKGQKARLGLLIALAHRPELLVLDEPSTGLDPVVRRDILGAIIRTIADEGRTVLFSSHLLEEVERVADHVTMISQGKIALSGPLDTIKQSHRRRAPRIHALLRTLATKGDEISGLAHAAERNPDRLATDTAGFLGCEERDRLGDLLRRGNTARGIQCRAFFPHLIGGDIACLRLVTGRTFRHLRAHPAGQHRVRRDAVGAGVLRDRAHQAQQPVFGAAVGTAGMLGNQA